MSNQEPVFSVTKKDLKIEWFSGTGAGGQHRNKHQNCVRITYVPFVITCVGQNHRERSRNWKDAFGNLAKKVVAEWLKRNQPERILSKTVIRVYHEPDNRVKDLASGFTMSYREIVEKNNIEPMIEARRNAILESEGDVND